MYTCLIDTPIDLFNRGYKMAEGVHNLFGLKYRFPQLFTP